MTIHGPTGQKGVVPRLARSTDRQLLLIAGRHVDADGVAEDIVDGLGGRDILARPADHDRRLTLEIHRCALASNQLAYSD